MDKYTKVARVYPGLVGMIIPWLIVVWSLWDNLPSIQANITKVFSYLGIFLSSALVFGAIGYAMREAIRSTSKWIFQFPIFKEDETKMPTTEMLLWKNHMISKEMHKNIIDEVKCRFNIQLPTEEIESEDEQEARLTIVNAVQHMRDITRNNSILLQYNYEFGFCRNYLGACIYSILFIIISLIINSHLKYIPHWGILILGLIQIFAMLIACISLKYRAKAYARSLFSTFLTQKES